MHSQGQQLQLYAKRVAVVPRSISGRFRSFKSAVLILGFAVYFGLPWLPWAREGAPAQAVLFDIPGRRFLIFDLTVYPQDIFLLSLFLFIAAALLFFVTALVGRAFCGYFCFQTLWTDAFIFIERWLQGERPQRLRLARLPWSSAEKLVKLGATRLAWLLLAFWTALTFVLYFGHAPSLLVRFFQGEAPAAAYITVLTLTLTTYLAAGLLREQVCMFICPYGRFQSVMYDPETLTVHYDRRRGEGTAGRVPARTGLRTREERQARGHGDCIDCGLCVQVCPVGIDIREGLQYSCIACGLCIDACDQIMDKMGFPRGLVRYDAEANLARTQPGPPRLDWRRLKVLGWGAALVCMTGVMAYDLTHRRSFELSIQQVRQPLYVVLSDGSIRNRYEIRLTNLSPVEDSYTVSARGIPPEALDLGHFHTITVRSGKSVTVQASVRLDPLTAARTPEFEFVVRNRRGETVVDPAHFFTRRSG
ncbi:MAG: cytochrome c oxidase accessory protein CcoG [Thiobacillaceae bacterium]|nr:cytochrome c oxidase accessory protein CcoG [Thiobacillaceae bacterium]